jgi:predicted ArsR family transcriptional regulator
LILRVFVATIRVMKSTREQMRDLLSARGEATVVELARELRLNQANIRRHLEVMRAEGLVDITIRRHEIGRPSNVYRLTERAEEMSAHYPRLVNRMVRQMASRPDAAPLLAQVFDAVADDVTVSHQAKVTGTTVAQRVAETSLTLKDEGIVDHWRKDDDGVFHLLNTTCPYKKAAEASDAPCHADHRVVQSLIGAPVEQVTRIVDGHHACEYVVRTPDDEQTGDTARQTVRPF